MSRKIIHTEGELINGTIFICESDPHLLPCGRKYRFGLFKCKYCGNEFESPLGSIRLGITKGCGCLKGNPKHNLCNSRLHRIWHGMKARCNNPNEKAYPDYGGRGVTVCDEWSKNFKLFYDWAMSNGYDDKLSIDRKDNEKGYHPDNCRWATRSIQQRNRRFRIGSKYPTGITFNSKVSHYYVRIMVDKKIIHLGTFNTVNDAEQRRRDYVKENNLIGFYND